MKFKKEHLDSMKMPSAGAPKKAAPGEGKEADPSDDSLEDELFGDSDEESAGEGEMEDADMEMLAAMSDEDILKEAARRGLQVMPAPAKKRPAAGAPMDDDEEADDESYV